MERIIQIIYRLVMAVIMVCMVLVYVWLLSEFIPWTIEQRDHNINPLLATIKVVGLWIGPALIAYILACMVRWILQPSPKK